MRRRASTRTVLVVGVLLSLLVAGVLSAWASASPDGLEHVARSLGFADTARDSATAESPLADYAAPVGGARLSGGLAGVVGVVVVGLVMAAVITVLRRHPAGDGKR